MSIPPRTPRTARTAVAALSAAGLLALGAAPAAFADEPAPALVLGDIAPIDGVKPGSAFEPSITVANKGTKAADKAFVYFSVTRGLDYAEVPSNCKTHQVSSYDEMTAKWNLVCEFAQTIEPGAVYAPEKPLAIKALDRALSDDLRVTVGDTDPELDESATTPVAGTAPAVKLVERQDGQAGSKDAVDVSVTSVNTADYKVTGTALKGGVGDTVTMKVEFANTGPAWVLTKEGDQLLKVLITPPAGTSVVTPHGYCDAEATGDAYECGTSQRWVDEDGGETYTFKLKIDKEVPGAKGSVALSDDARPFDPDKSNDKADITLDVTGGGSSGSTGSTGSSGSGDSTGGSASGSTGGSGAETASTGGDLAATGSSSSTMPIAAVGAAVLVAGAGTVFLVRRRAQQLG